MKPVPPALRAALAALSFCALSLTCAGTGFAQAPSEPPTNADTLPSGKPPANDVMYLCPGGQDFTAHFSDDGDLATLHVAGQPRVDLSRLRSGTGFAYGDSYYELRGRGREATLSVHGSSSVRCRAAGRPGEPARSFSGPRSTLTLFPDGTFRERVSGTEPPAAVLGLWTEEVDGGLRLVLHGGQPARRTFRTADDGDLVASDSSGTVLRPLVPADPIDEAFRLDGMFRVGPQVGLFAECVTARTFYLSPEGAEAEMEHTWTQAAPGREAQIYASIVGRFTADGHLSVERFVGSPRGQTCRLRAAPSAALRDTDWRAAQIDGAPLKVEDRRQLPTLTLDDAGLYSGSTGCNRISGSYTLDAKGLRFAAGAITRMACEPPAGDIEQRFLAALAAVTGAHLAATTLELQDATGAKRLRLEARGR
jgi:heat shock protein HslJ/membrane-bound inhibitor of C-type lysozyme